MATSLNTETPPSLMNPCKFMNILCEESTPLHSGEVFSPEMKPSVASLQATVMSNATLAAAAAYQSHLGLAGTRPMGDQANSSLSHHHHDAALLHDYHSL
uniref:Uncharacterized protein n=1 Tax=Timema genevievae TaxID=629358 RepID=A0A7R9K4E8_TIMGE|nr:unnamed protein product [Timema genevievae]